MHLVHDGVMLTRPDAAHRWSIRLDSVDGPGTAKATEARFAELLQLREVVPAKLLMEAAI
jgi:hypothetical protein